MIGERQTLQRSIFYEFSLEDHVPVGHLLRSIDRFVDLSNIRRRLEPFYSRIGRPSIDPELMLRMLIIGYSHGIRSEQRLCEEVHLNLANPWFCGLDLNGAVPDHSTFSKDRHGGFRDCDLFRLLFEGVLARCMAEGLVGGKAFGVDASLIKAGANREDGLAPTDWAPEERASRATSEIWSRWMTLPLARRCLFSQSIYRPSIQLRDGRRPIAGKPTSYTQLTTWSIWTTRS